MAKITFDKITTKRPGYPSRQGNNPTTGQKYDQTDGQRDHIIPIKEIHNALVDFFNSLDEPTQKVYLIGFINSLEQSRKQFIEELAFKRGASGNTAERILDTLIEISSPKEDFSKLFAWLPGNLVVGVNPNPNTRDVFDTDALVQAQRVFPAFYDKFYSRWEDLQKQKTKEEREKQFQFIKELAGLESPTW